MNDKGVCRTAPATPGLLIRPSKNTALFYICENWKLPKISNTDVFSILDVSDKMKQIFVLESHAVPSNIICPIPSEPGALIMLAPCSCLTQGEVTLGPDTVWWL